MMEWVWLLRWYERVRETPTTPYADILFENVLAYGKSASGLLFHRIDTDGRVQADSKRLWPMSELIKAALSQARAGNADGERIAAEAIGTFFTRFVPGTSKSPYVDQLDSRDRVADGRAAASSMYHLVSAALEVLARIGARRPDAEHPPK